MRAITIVVVIGLSMGTCVQCVTWGAQDIKLDLAIRLDNESFVELQPIWLSVSATNSGEQEIRILPLVLTCLGCLEIALVNSEGDTLPYNGTVRDVTRPPTGYLAKPGEAHSNSINLLEGFGEKMDAFGIRRVLPPGTYSVLAIYGGVIQSNTIHFIVSSPEGDDAKAHSLIKDGYNYHSRSELSRFYEKLRKLVADHPSSAYADLAYYEMTYWAPDPEDARRYGQELILNYPNSRFTRFAFWKILRGQPHDEQIKFLKDILAKLPPDSRAAEWAEGSLEALTGD